jgi:hypothetical protein
LVQGTIVYTLLYVQTVWAINALLKKIPTLYTCIYIYIYIYSHDVHFISILALMK